MLSEKKYIPKFNSERYEEWVKCSIGWLIFEESEGTLTTKLQGLGIIDAELYDINKVDIKQELNNDLTVFDHVNIKSYLWILGIYEFFRMFDQKLRENPTLVDDEIIKLTNKVKKEFARIRVPLAKMEPANKYKKTDFAIPKLGANNIQIGWRINENEVIWYRDLSNLAINVLNQMRTYRINKNINNNA